MIPNSIIWGDCLQVMQDIPDKSIDMILVDPPYGSTQVGWDKIIPIDLFWEQHNRVIKDNGAVVITANQPFASQLIVGNIKHFKYDLIYAKNRSTGFLNAKKMPLRAHESILVFYRKPPVYNAQKTEGHPPVHNYTKQPNRDKIYRETKRVIVGGGQTDRYPRSIIKFNGVNNDSKDRINTAQKPVELFSWLIRTYSNEGDVVLDSCAGSCTTAVACVQENRQFICIESDHEMYLKAKQRVIHHKTKHPIA